MATTKTIAKQHLIDPLAFTWDDIGVGKLFADTFANCYRYVMEANLWYLFDGRVWIPDANSVEGEKLTKELVKTMYQSASKIKDYKLCGEYHDFIKKMSSNKARKAMLISARSVNPLPISYFDKNPFLLNCQNGTYDLKTMIFRPHNPTDYMTKICNVTFDENATCARFDQFICEIMQNDQDKMRFLQKALGYALTGDTSQECLFILRGKATRNGKGTLMETIKYLLGDYARTAQPETFSLNSQNRGSGGATEDIARLKGARLVIVNEPDIAIHLNEALLKQLTGGDTVTARFLYKNSFEYRPEYKIFLICNNLPIISDDSIYRSHRIKVIPFERHFNPEEQDHNLKAFFCKTENLSGILNWLIEGCKMYYAEGLKLPESVQAAVIAYQEENDIIGSFIKECLIPIDGGKLKVGVAYNRYTLWVGNNRVISQRDFVGKLRERVNVKYNGHIGNYIANYKLQ